VRHLLARLQAPSRGVDDDGHGAAGDDTGDWEGDEPAHVDPGNHSPVDSFDGSSAEGDTDGGTSDALSGGGGQGKTGSQNDGKSSTQLHGETTGRRVQGEAVTQVTHHVVTVSPETDRDSSTSIDQDPDGDFRSGRSFVSPPDLVDGSEGTDTVRDIVGTVTE